eukprot:Hpha_TRINITY_DN1708_c0_g1::TRINITY_DN1708_c0_g1_i2::g.158501::m.158501
MRRLVTPSGCSPSPRRRSPEGWSLPGEGLENTLWLQSRAALARHDRVLARAASLDRARLDACWSTVLSKELRRARSASRSPSPAPPQPCRSALRPTFARRRAAQFQRQRSVDEDTRALAVAAVHEKERQAIAERDAALRRHRDNAGRLQEQSRLRRHAEQAEAVREEQRRTAEHHRALKVARENAEANALASRRENDRAAVAARLRAVQDRRWAQERREQELQTARRNAEQLRLAASARPSERTRRRSLSPSVPPAYGVPAVPAIGDGAYSRLLGRRSEMKRCMQEAARPTRCAASWSVPFRN